LAKAIDPDVRAHLATLVREERAHAILADDIETWARAVGGASVAAALDSALRAVEVPASIVRDGETLSEWGGYGRLTGAEARSAFLDELSALRGRA